MGSCWNNTGPRYNRWFKFTAPSTGQIYVDVGVFGTKGTQARTQLALWEDDGITELACDRYVLNNDNVDLGAVGLTPGGTYYISVDVHSISAIGTFTLCLDSLVDYDFYEGALDVTSLIGGCSNDAEYTTRGASPDRAKGSCWNNSGPRYNRWFKFTAPSTSQIYIKVEAGGSKGTQTRTQLALWEDDGITEVACDKYFANNDRVVDVGSVALVPGQTYYVSVDVYSSSNNRTFTLCIDSVADYDFYEGAVDLTPMIGLCSDNAEYTTIGASPDRLAGSCWNNSGPVVNRWFKFTAPSTGMINVKISRGGTLGTQAYTQVTIWSTDGVTEVSCNRYTTSTDIVEVSATNLTPGVVYYISVDSRITNVGTFTICLDNKPNYDYFEGAYDVTQYIGGCSPNAAFTTVGATPDKVAASCWNNNGPIKNRWFVFEAPASGMIDIKLEIGGGKGTQTYSQIALWEDDGITEIACNFYYLANQGISIGAAHLIPGKKYYVSVDSRVNNVGTFTLCLDDKVNYDYKEGAIELTDLHNWCSASAEYTTLGATPDQISGSCWYNSNPTVNRWFKFKAVYSKVTVTVNIGSLRYAELALWEDDGITQRTCSRYSNSTSDVSLIDSQLTVGNWYYISVDSRARSNSGTFSLCIDNIEDEYYSIASGNWNIPSNWSNVSHTGPPAASYPKSGDVAYIRGHEILVDNNEECAQLNITAADNTTNLTIDNSSLGVYGTVLMENAGDDEDGVIDIINAGKLEVNDKLTLNRLGGANKFDINVASGGELTVNKDFTIYSTGGTVHDNNVYLYGDAKLTVGRDLILENNAGAKSKLFADSITTIQLNGDVEFIATSDNQIEIEMKDSSRFRILGNFNQHSPAYGAMSFKDDAVIEFVGTSPQSFPTLKGSGSGDYFDIKYFIINNTYGAAPQLTLTDDVEVPIQGSLSLIRGVLHGQNMYGIRIPNGATISSGNANSYIDGDLTIEGDSDVHFPLGEGNVWAPLDLKNITGGPTTEFTARYFFKGHAVQDIKDHEPISHISKLEYWEVSNNGGTSEADVVLHWKNRNRSGIDDYFSLAVASFDGVEWEEVGHPPFVLASNPGSLEVKNIDRFIAFTFASINPLANPLPIVLTDFSAKVNENGVLLFWETQSEINNDYFKIERSSNGKDFTPIAQIEGNGNSSITNYYTLLDNNPFVGINYYRLTQVDYDGKVEYFNPIAVSFSEVGDLSVTVYPNPTVEHVEVKVNNNRPFTLTLRSIDGRLISKETYTQSKANVNLPYSKGVYLLEILMDNNKLIEKIIKQ